MCLQEFCKRHSIPTAAHAVFHSAAEAKAHLQQQQAYPVVIKADGLAGGKGVIIAEDLETACRTVDSMISDAQFGEAGLQMRVLAQGILAQGGVWIFSSFSFLGGDPDVASERQLA